MKAKFELPPIGLIKKPARGPDLAGITPAVIIAVVHERMAREHAGYYGLSCGASKCSGWHGFGDTARWTTCTGNTLAVSYYRSNWGNDGLIIEVEGRRHGIPWRFLEEALEALTGRANALYELVDGAGDKWLHLEMESQSDQPPWRAADGAPMIAAGGNTKLDATATKLDLES